MLSILLKRQAQTKATALAERLSMPEPEIHEEGDTTRPTLADKPWDETQNILKQDLAYLRTLAGSQEKEPYKQQLVEKYQPLVAKLLTTHKSLEGLDVVWWFYQWQVDLGKLPQVHECLRAAVAMGLDTPNGWKSNGQTAYCDIVFKYSHSAYTEKAEFNREYLMKAVLDILEGNLATNAPLKVKMFRLVGDWHYEKGESEKAYILFEQVMALDPNKGGRKTKLNELKEELGYGDSN
ncbi:phage terminase small subunit [Vibrio sp. JC009]|uniref:phage terminase small subunit n=1 Tax=Vibrio sp. JC009 TaxID=2912314 RepID=UPI0023AF9BFB|nr:phage terminase small subunit [Vibrio sp. JC009]WED23522.1 phage terminase small subunit [Vibrio sp. JC009]